MIIDEETRIRRNKQLRRDLKKQSKELRKTKKQANKMLDILRDRYAENGNTTNIEILACTYYYMNLNNVFDYIANMGFITYTQRGDAYIVDFVMPEAEKSTNTTKPPKAETVKKEPAKPPKPKIDDVEPKIEDIWPD